LVYIKYLKLCLKAKKHSHSGSHASQTCTDSVGISTITINLIVSTRLLYAIYPSTTYPLLLLGKSTCPPWLERINC